MNAAIKEGAATTTQEVCRDLCSLGIPKENQFGIRATAGVGRELVVGRENTVVGGLARQVGIKRRVDQVFVTAAGDTIANGFDQGGLATRVGLIIAAGEKQVNSVAIGGRATLRRGTGGAGCGGGQEGKKRQCWSHRDAFVP